jgi:hypothetical protein
MTQSAYNHSYIHTHKQLQKVRKSDDKMTKIKQTKCLDL